MPPSSTTPADAARFRTTHWSVVHAAVRRPREPGGEDGGARDAFAELCAVYWYPLYAYARRRGHDAEEARDLTQGFFAGLLEGSPLERADPERGRFRAYLVGAFEHFLSHERERAAALKRGGGRAPLALDDPEAEARYGTVDQGAATPERLFDRAWARTLLARVVARLEAEQEERGRGEVFARLEAFLGGAEAPAGGYAALADELGMSAVAVRVSVHRLRARLGEILREEVARTVDDRRVVEDELRWLFEALGG